MERPGRLSGETSHTEAAHTEGRTAQTPAVEGLVRVLVRSGC